jgi:hypothetical protein
VATIVPAIVPACPPASAEASDPHLAQMKKDAELKARGALAMGFDQEKTTHHFLLTADGGIIEVAVSDPSDIANRDAIRSHLKDIAGEFARGDFTKPFATHNQVPPRGEGHAAARRFDHIPL